MAEKDPKAKGKQSAKSQQGGQKLFGLQISKGPIKVLKWHIGIVLGVLGIGALTGFFFTRHKEDQLKLEGLNAEIAQMEDKLRNVENIKSEREKTQVLIAEKLESIAHLERGLPDFKFIPDFMVQMEQLAYGFNMKVMQFIPQAAAAPPPPPPAAPPGGEEGGAAPAPAPAPGVPPPPGQAAPAGGKTFKWEDEFAAQTVDMELAGHFNDLLLFTQELAVFPKVVVLDSLVLKTELEPDENPLANGEKDSIVRVRMMFKFYSRKEKQETPAPAAAPATPPTASKPGKKQPVAALKNERPVRREARL